MKIRLLIAIILILLFGTASFAQEKYINDLVVLNENTFVKIYNSEDDFRIIQLFKVEVNQINLVDAILIDEKKVSFAPLFEYKRLKIELKDR